MKVMIYTDTNKAIGDADHLKVFASQEAADAWFRRNDPEGVAFEYEVMGTLRPVRIGNGPVTKSRTQRRP